MKGNAPSETRGADTIYEFIDTINSWLVASPLKSNFLARPGFSLIDGKLTPWNCSVAPTSRREYRLPGNCREGCEQSCPPADRTESIFRQKLSRPDTMTGATLPNPSVITGSEVEINGRCERWGKYNRRSFRFESRLKCYSQSYYRPSFIRLPRIYRIIKFTRFH